MVNNLKRKHFYLQRSILSRKNKIRQGHQGPPIFAVGVPVQASLGPSRIIVSKFASASEGSGIVNQGTQRLWTDGNKFLFFEDLGNEFASVTVPVFHRVNKRQRDFAFFQIAKHGFPELLCRRD